MTTATALDLQLHVDAPDVAGPLAVFPLFGPPPRATYLPFRVAATRGCTITERPGGASVNDLVVRNDTPDAVLLLDGEEVAGAQQDRTFDMTVLVAPRTTMEVPVSCVEHGRWDGRRHHEPFTSAERTAFPELRRLKADRGRALRADQGAVWSAVSAKHARLGTHSPTDAMRDAYEGHHDHLESLRRAIRFRPGQVGMLAAIGGRLRVLDHASRPDAFAVLAAPLVRGYALDALEAPLATPPAPTVAEAQAFVDDLLRGRVEPRPGVGLGTHVRVEQRAAFATALVHDGEVVQLSAFAR
jgi:hypothetical protein